MRRVIQAFIRPGDDSGYVGVCPELSAVTQGADLDETVANLREVIGLALAGEDLAELGLAPDPAIVVTLETAPIAA